MSTKSKPWTENHKKTYNMLYSYLSKEYEDINKENTS